MRRALAVLACLGTSGCIAGVSGSAGVTLDTAGNVGILAKGSSLAGLELTPHEEAQEDHVGLSFPAAVDLFAGYDFGRGSAVFGADFGLRGIYVSDPAAVAVTGGAALRIATWVGRDRAFTAFGPVGHLGIHRVLATKTRAGCQPGDAARRWTYGGAVAEGGWSYPNLAVRPFGTLYVAPSYGFAGTTALCFSERSDGRNSETGREIE